MPAMKRLMLNNQPERVIHVVMQCSDPVCAPGAAGKAEAVLP